MASSCRLSCKLCTAPEARLADYQGQLVKLVTNQGEIVIQPFYDDAPRAASLVLQLAHKGRCPLCRFYRNEVAPQAGSGPPYGLLQGSLGVSKVPPREGSIQMKKGMVAFIPTTVDFFIAAMDHPEWGTSHIVWGQVTNASLPTVAAVLARPYNNFTHPEHGTLMRMMAEPVPFAIQFVLPTTAGLGRPGQAMPTGVTRQLPAAL